MEEKKPPASFWTVMISLASLMIAALGVIIGESKSDVAETRRLEQRLCRLEAVSATGECKR